MNVVVTTTINPPTKAVLKYDALEDWHLIVVGDLKTPEDYRLERGTYLSPSDQEAIDKELSDLIGWNNVERRNLGLLAAWRMGADVVATIDDDNVPLDHWGTNLFVGQELDANFYETDLVAFDPVGATNYPHLWHRGYPLMLLAQRDYSSVRRSRVHADIQADFWNGDPDVDAICRMQFAPDCEFDPDVFPLTANVMSPFNSQNTFLTREWLSDYFIFPGIGRMEDIWASYYLQAKGARVVYGRPSVVQERNPHDLVVDMKAEYLGYERGVPLVETLAKDPDAIAEFVPERTMAAFRRYQELF